MALTPDPVTVVQTMWDAWHDGRMDDVVATMDPQVVWTPLTRPALSIYRGHAAIRRLRDDSINVHGSYRTEVDRVTLQPDGSVSARGLLFVVPENAGPYLKFEFEAVCFLRDGLIISIDSYERRP